MSLSRLEVLETLRLDGTNLCVFPDEEFQAWLDGIPNLSLPPACDNSDMGVLVSLYNATNGSNWTHSDGWLNSPNLNDWFGVTVNAEGRVTRVSLSNNGLSGPLPLELGYLDQLTELHLNVNDLSGSIPESFGNLTLLRSLNLSHNRKLQGSLPIEMIRSLKSATPSCWKVRISACCRILTCRHGWTGFRVVMYIPVRFTIATR